MCTALDSLGRHPCIYMNEKQMINYYFQQFYHSKKSLRRNFSCATWQTQSYGKNVMQLTYIVLLSRVKKGTEMNTYILISIMFSAIPICIPQEMKTCGHSILRPSPSSLSAKLCRYIAPMVALQVSFIFVALTLGIQVVWPKVEFPKTGIGHNSETNCIYRRDLWPRCIEVVYVILLLFQWQLVCLNRL